MHVVTRFGTFNHAADVVTVFDNGVAFFQG
jgi:hypothetical protein